MKKSVRLFIGSYEADLGSAPDILYTFKIDDITSPAAVKNSYSKTITLMGTPRNNRIFTQYWAGDRITGNGFDATVKTPFALYVDNEVYQKGYCKLNEIVQNRNAVQYSVSLFGGLGELMANLEYDGDDKKKLSSLDFGQDLGFTINKETVLDAWNNIGSGKWGILNFAACYDGTPKDFDANKVLMNLSGYTGGGGYPDGWRPRPGGNTARNEGIVTSVTEDEQTYSTYGGYALAELSRAYTSAEMREFRSYLMRPVLNVSKTIEAICNPANNGGYTIELDADWFNQNNPYWADLWMTLPLLSSLEYNAAEVATGVTVSTGAKQTGTSTASGDPRYYEDTLAILSDTGSGESFDVSVNISLDLNCSASTGDTLVLCAYNGTQGIYYPSAVFVQLVAYDVAGNPVAGGDSVYLTSSYGQRRSSDGRSSSAYFIEPSEWNYAQPYGDGCVKSGYHYFSKVSNGHYRWAENLNLTAQNVPGGSRLKILVTRVYKSGNRPNSGKVIFESHAQGGQSITYSYSTFEDFDVVINSSQVAFKSNQGIRTGASFTKKQLLDSQYSPADFLLSYCKCFGLYLLQDAVEKKVSILTRKNFFKRDEIEDIERYVDRQDFKITPLVFTTKWYDWNLEADEGEYAKAYETTYGKKYGQQLVNTEYNFDNGTTEVLSGNIFKNAVQVLERSNAFCYTQDDAKLKPYMFAGYKYLLYNVHDNTDTYEVEVAASSTIDAFVGLSMQYYDLFDKVQLHGDNNNPAGGADVLLFYGGKKPLTAGSTQLNYYITDDSSYMNILNQSRPCWLYTNSETDKQGQSIATKVTEVPYFSRYDITSTGYIKKSLDFGTPEETYIPNVVRLSGNTIFEQFWNGYISDLYSKDTHTIKTKMLFKKKPDFGCLRRFYWFNGAIYRLLGISDYNAAKNGLTDVEFVRVQDVANYTSEASTSGSTISLTLSSNSLSSSGGTVSYTITAPDDMEWHLQASTGTTDVVSGTGTYTGTWTVSANAYAEFRQLTLTALAEGATASATLTQEGYTVSIELLDTDEVSYTGGTVRFKVVVMGSTWTAGTDYTGIITAITPTSGVATDASGVTVTASFGANEYSSPRTAYIYIELPNGGRRRSPNVTQIGEGQPYIRFYPPQLSTNVGASGGTYLVSVEANTGWTANNFYSGVCHTDTLSGTSGVTDIYVTVEENEGTSTRSGSILFYLDGDSSTYSYFVMQQGASFFYFNNDGQTGTTTAVTVESASGSVIVNWETDGEEVRCNMNHYPTWVTTNTTTTQGTFTFTENDTGADRTGTIELFAIDGEGNTVGGCYLTITQLAAD